MCAEMEKDGDNASSLTKSLYALACGPHSCIKSYSACIVNGVRYHTELRDERKLCQNSSVMVAGSMESGNSIEFYGVIQDIIELQYNMNKRTFIFKCKWWDLGRNQCNVRLEGHVKSIKVQKTWYDNDPFVLATQVKQVYYLQDLKNGPMWRVVQKHEHRDLYDVPIQLCSVPGITNENDQMVEGDMSASDIEENTVDDALELNVVHHEINLLHRSGVEPTYIDADTVTHSIHNIDQDYDNNDGQEDDDDTLIEYLSSDGDDNDIDM